MKNTILSLNVDKKTNTAILFTLLYSTKSTLTQIKAELGHSREILSSIYSWLLNIEIVILLNIEMGILLNNWNSHFKRPLELPLFLDN